MLTLLFCLFQQIQMAHMEQIKYACDIPNFIFFFLYEIVFVLIIFVIISL